MAGSETRFALLCRAGNAHCALPLEQVVETLRPPANGADTAIVRGASVPVLDVGRWFGGDEPPSRLIVTCAGERRLGLAVDAVVGLRTMAAEAFQRLRPLLADAPENATDALDTGLVSILSSARIVPAGIAATLEIEAPAW